MTTPSTSLQNFLNGINSFNKATNKPELSLAKPEDVKELADRLSCLLSPEVLTCDGELSSTEVNKKMKYYQEIADGLWDIDPSLTFDY